MPASFSSNNKAWVGGTVSALSALVVAPIDWANLSTEWIPHILAAIVAGLAGGGAVWVTPNKEEV